MQAIFVSFLFAGLISRASAGVFITDPTASSNLNGGQAVTISWKDDSLPPKLTDVGACEFGLYAGSIQQQTELQPIAAAVDVSKQNSVNFTINPAIGPNSTHYFIRVTSINLKDSKNPQDPYESFSAVFTLSNMKGQFSAAVQAQIAGANSTSAANATTPTSAAPTSSGLVKVSTTSNPSPTQPAPSSASAAATHSSATLVTQFRADFLGALGAIAVLAGLMI